ncbi:MAG: restriction endonuclease subunit S [Bradyrhizobium sp.]|uniref:restriction endonuclease subunit S n=1 Tax=Pseudomonadota TaxID=1224 RepID=UPI003D0F89AE
MSWATSTVGECLAKVKRPGKLQTTDYQETGQFPIIDQGQGEIAGYTDQSEVVIQEPLPLVIFGDHTRRVKLAKEPFACGADGTQLLYPNRTDLDPTFFFYAVKSIDLSNYFYARHFKFLKEQKFSFPLLPTQVRIAAVLSAYDDLIENNRRRMALLEEAARQLYREWFVRLRFPGHEHARIIDGVPEGWERKTAYDALEILSGGTPKTSVSDYWDGDIPFYTPKDAVDGLWVTDAERSITEMGLAQCNSKLYPRETVFISARGTVGKLNMAQRPMAMSQSCYALFGKEGLGQPFVFFAMQAAVEALKQQAVGAVFDAIVVETFKRIHLLIPDEKLLRLFDESFRLVLQQVENLTIQNQKLGTARDLLLPRLMSGEIAV